MFLLVSKCVNESSYLYEYGESWDRFRSLYLPYDKTMLYIGDHFAVGRSLKTQAFFGRFAPQMHKGKSIACKQSSFALRRFLRPSRIYLPYDKTMLLMLYMLYIRNVIFPAKRCFRDTSSFCRHQTLLFRQKGLHAP